MGRAPCCDKVGLKRGPWTPEEDQVLISFIQRHGHSNWRALPKQAGLLRCGKSCRLRWINYLRPDIKRGNFSKEEEDTIIQLHEMMGNRWSAIAARLPGRTDNEIKNVWHTHLKKRLENKQYHPPKPKNTAKAKVTKKHIGDDEANNNVTTSNSTTASTTTSLPQCLKISRTSNSTISANSSFLETVGAPANSSQRSYSSDDFSSLTDVSSVKETTQKTVDDQEYYSGGLDDYFPIIDETFWSSQEQTKYDDINLDSVFSDIVQDDQVHQFEQSYGEEILVGSSNNDNNNNNNNCQLYQADSMDFWLEVFVKASGAPELPEF